MDSDNELLYSINKRYNTNNNSKEFTLYLAEDIVDYKVKPLEYQYNNRDRYPYLYLLSKEYLGIPATSASIKSTFSISNNIIIKSRNKLNANTVRILILLKSWDY